MVIGCCNSFSEIPRDELQENLVEYRKKKIDCVITDREPLNNVRREENGYRPVENV